MKNWNWNSNTTPLPFTFICIRHRSSVLNYRIPSYPESSLSDIDTFRWSNVFRNPIIISIRDRSFTLMLRTWENVGKANGRRKTTVTGRRWWPMIFISILRVLDADLLNSLIIYFRFRSFLPYLPYPKEIYGTANVCLSNASEWVLQLHLSEINRLHCSTLFRTVSDYDRFC